MSEEVASIEDVIASLKEALDKTGIIIETPYYVFALYEVGPGRWKQVQYVFEDKEGFIETIDERRALLYLIEEVSKSLINLGKGDWNVILSPGELEDVISKMKEG
ncbi:MAG: hypothetical protein ACP6IP_00800 [Candidatus Njordarchaeia archaeon]